LSRHLETGRRGEELAVAYLKKQGCRIIDRNVNTPFGELDIICRDKSVIVFVEVKTRTSNAFGRPYEAVGPDKKRRLSRSAQYWLAEKKWMDKPARFDVISVTVREAEKDEIDIEHLADAFEAAS
jgi:putative endonuclease